jgi:alcohol dehydrogenase (cytochrome c)
MMRRLVTDLLLGAVCLATFAITAHGQVPPAPPAQNNLVAAPTPTATPRSVPNFAPVTDEVMRAPRPEDWLMLRGNYQGWGYSPLDQINKTNVKNLQLVWSRVMEPGIN